MPTIGSWDRSAWKTTVNSATAFASSTSSANVNQNAKKAWSCISMSTCLFKKVRKQVEYSRLKCRRSFVYASRSRCRRRCRRTSYVVLRLVVPLKKVRFEDGSYGLSFEADLEVFGHGNKVHTFLLHFIKANNKLFVDGDGTFVTSDRDNPSR